MAGQILFSLTSKIKRKQLRISLKTVYLVSNVENVGTGANVILTAANQKRTALGIERELPQVHGTTGHYRQPVKQPAIHSNIIQQGCLAFSHCGARLCPQADVVHF
jgi:hypothetical protein